MKKISLFFLHERPCLQNFRLTLEPFKTHPEMCHNFFKVICKFKKMFFFSNLPFFAFKVIVTNIHQKFTDCSSNPPIFSFTNNLEHFVNDPWLFLLSIYYSTTQMNFIQPPLYKFLRLAQNLGHISIVPENLIHLQ